VIRLHPSVPALLGAAVLASACGGRASAARTPSVPVVVAVAVQKDVPVQLEAIGTVEPLATVTVKPQVGGIIDTVHFREGTDVRAGDLLFTIHQRPFEVALRQAESTRARDVAQLKNAEAEARRADSLFGQGILARETYEQARASADALAATVAADDAAIETARVMLGYCLIRSPIDGRTGSLLVHAGNLVKAIDNAPLVVVNRVDPVYVSFAVAEKRLGEIERAMGAGRLVVSAVVPGEDATPIPGQLTFLDNTVDRSTGTIRLKGTFPNRDRRLWPGQFVGARLTVAMRAAAVVIPSQAVQSGQAGAYVYVVKPDMTAEPRPVVVVQDAGGEAVVEKGVAAGEQVVTDGQLRLVPGATVDPKAAAAPTPRTAS
jgi:membrane fusion protein, multidrug efflux system